MTPLALMKTLVALSIVVGCASCSNRLSDDSDSTDSSWLLVDNFQSGLNHWTHIDVQNDTNPFVANPQIAKIQRDPQSKNQFMLRKPAPDGVVGNRKAIGFRPLPVAVQVGETYTFYTRISVEYFPNNQSFGLASVAAEQIPNNDYNAFEAMIRVTDKAESNGHRNDGTLQVLGGGDMRYSNIVNPTTGKSAQPLRINQWYELWYVVNNSSREQGGQSYDLYLRGGEFSSQQRVFENAQFRMGREKPLAHFMTICNTGPADEPYGNGGVRYDDIYMAAGRQLTTPVK